MIFNCKALSKYVQLSVFWITINEKHRDHLYFVSQLRIQDAFSCWNDYFLNCSTSILRGFVITAGRKSSRTWVETAFKEPRNSEEVVNLHYKQCSQSQAHISSCIPYVKYHVMSFIGRKNITIPTVLRAELLMDQADSCGISRRGGIPTSGLQKGLLPPGTA